MAIYTKKFTPPTHKTESHLTIAGSSSQSEIYFAPARSNSRRRDLFRNRQIEFAKARFISQWPNRIREGEIYFAMAKSNSRSRDLFRDRQIEFAKAKFISQWPDRIREAEIYFAKPKFISRMQDRVRKAKIIVSCSLDESSGMISSFLIDKSKKRSRIL